MKTFRIILLILVASTLDMTVSAQLGGLMNKIKKEVANKVLGTSGDVKDPACATNDAVVIYKFARDEKIAMNEVSFCHTSKGAILIQNKMSKAYYVIMNGKQSGPFPDGDPALNEFGYCSQRMQDTDDVTVKYNGFVFRQGDRYVIRFAGKTYGPYDQILSFTVSSLQDKFVASVYEKMLKESDLGDMSKFEKEIENAKTDAERTQLAMQMSQKVSAAMIQKGGMSTGPQVVSNIPDVNWNPLLCTTNSDIKFNDIVEVTMSDIKDIRGNDLYTFKSNEIGLYEKFWLNNDNSQWAGYSNGKITFSGGKEINEVFSPYIDQFDGKTFLTYMYFSPVKEAIMQVRIPF
jgi:hypothetical protein